MFLLTAATTIDPNTAAIVGYAVMAIALVLAVLIAVALVKTILKKLKKAASEEAVESAPAAVAAAVSAPASPSATAPGSAGQIKLNNVDPKTAAMLMAIVADKTGKPLNELRFISVKEIK